MGIYVRNRKVGSEIRIPNPIYVNEYLEDIDINDIIQYNLTGITSITKTYLNDNDVEFNILPDLSGAESLVLTNIIDGYKNKTGYTTIENANKEFEHNIKPILKQDFVFPNSYAEAINENNFGNINAEISGITKILIDELNASGYTNLTYSEKRIIAKWHLDSLADREAILTEREINYNTYRLSYLLNKDQFTTISIDYKDTISGSTLDANYYTGRTGNTRYLNEFILLNNFNTYTGDTETKINFISGNTLSIVDFNQYSGDTQTDFNSYTANTQTELEGKLGTGYTPTWSDISNFSGSSLSDIETRNSSDISYTETNWDITDVEDALNKLTDYIEITQGSGRIEPEVVLSGLYGTMLYVASGTGFINYENFHKKITWDAVSIETAGDPEGTYYVYVDSNGDVQVSTTNPNPNLNIRLGFYYQGGFIGVIQQCGCLIDSSINRTVDFALRQGVFIYDNGGNVEVLDGDNLKIVSSPCKVQYGLSSTQLFEVTSNDVSGYTFLNYYDSADFGLALDWYFTLFNEGRIPTNRWNDITKNSFEPLTAYTASFTFGSNIITSTSDLSGLDLENSYVYQSGDTDNYMTPVSGVTWDGSGTTITLEAPYYGTGSSGTIITVYCLPKLPAGKYAKHLIVRSSDGLMYLVLAQTYYDSEIDAKSGVLPAINESLVNVAIKMAYIVNVSEETDLSGNIYDIRPLPYQFREGGQQGGGTVITNHGNLTGLGNDDHLQYLKTDGSRNITGIQRYNSQPNFTTDLDIISKKYVDDTDSLKLNTIIFTGYTASTNTTITGIENNVIYLSGQTDLKLNISDFNSYTGDTDTRFNDINADILELSGITSGLTGTYVEIGTFTGYTATTDTTLNSLQTQINSLSGVTGLSAVQIRRTTALTITATLTNINYDTTDVENNPDVLEHDNINTDRINIKEDGLYLILFDSDATNTSGTGNINFEINKNVTNTLLSGGDSTVRLYAGEIHKLTHGILSELNAGDYVTTRINRLTTTAQLNPPITLSIISLKGIKGAKGNDGAPGTGSTIKVFEDGVNVHPTGGTFQTLNFTTGFSLSGGTDQVNIVGEIPIPPMVVLVDSVGGQELDNVTPVPINWGQQNRIDTNYFTHTIGNSTITILQDGLYEISYNVNSTNQTNARSTSGVVVRINGITQINPTLSASYSRNLANDDNQNSIPPYPISLTIGDVVEITGYRLGDANSTLTKAGASFVRINYLG